MKTTIILLTPESRGETQKKVISKAKQETNLGDLS